MRKQSIVFLGLLLLTSSVVADNRIFFNVSYQQIVVLPSGNKTIMFLPAEGSNVTICVYATNALGQTETAGGGCTKGFVNSSGIVVFGIGNFNTLQSPVVEYVVSRPGYDIVNNRIMLSSITTSNVVEQAVGYSGTVLGVIQSVVSGQGFGGYVLNQLNPWAIKPTISVVHFNDQHIDVSLVPTSLYELSWTDVFPGCSTQSGLSAGDSIRCLSEFLVPNLHIASTFNLLYLSFRSAFSLLNNLSAFIGKATALDLGGVADIIFNWIIGILTPLGVILLSYCISFLIFWLYVLIAYLGYAAALDITLKVNALNSGNFMVMVIGVAVVGLIASAWFLTIDYAKYIEPLIQTILGSPGSDSHLSGGSVIGGAGGGGGGGGGGAR